MYILLQQKNRILIPCETKSHNILINSPDFTNEYIIKKFIETYYKITVVKLKTQETDHNFIIAIVDDNKDLFMGESVSFSAVIDMLSNTEIDESVKKYIEHQQLQSNIKLQYGLRNDKIISINEITEDEKGLKCHCFCSGCGMPLQAKLGNGKRQRHFAHNNASCNIVSAQQSALHMLAKEIIEKEGKIHLPSLKVAINDIPNLPIDTDYYYDLPDDLIFRSSQLVRCNKVILEKKISNIVPDIIIEVSGRICLIEIAVTHFIDEVKNQKIKELGFPVVEIDLSSLYGTELTREDLRKIIIEENDYKSWIYNPLKEEALIWATKEYTSQYNDKKRKENERKKAQAEQQKRREEQRKKAKLKFKELSKPDCYRAVLCSLRNDAKVMEVCKNLTFYRDNSYIPAFMDIPITGEMVFDCDRRIWQSTIFDKFIYNRKQDESISPTVHIQKILIWVKKYQDDFNLNWDLVPSIPLQLTNSSRERSLLNECIKQYLDYLSYLGFISNVYDQTATVLCSHNLLPPNKKEWSKFTEILKRVDKFAPDINDQIHSMQYPNSITLSQVNNKLKPCKSEEERYKQWKKIKNDQLAKSRQLEYDAGFEEIISNNKLGSNEIARDSFGHTWLVCTECGEIKRDDETVYSDGNIGLCRECSRR